MLKAAVIAKRVVRGALIALAVYVVGLAAMAILLSYYVIPFQD